MSFECTGTCWILAKKSFRPLDEPTEDVSNESVPSLISRSRLGDARHETQLIESKESLRRRDAGLGFDEGEGLRLNE
jgi:hypothetical protein